jgi:hypothetical protein
MKLTRLNELIEDGEVVRGEWELDRNHEVRYRVKGASEEVKLKASLFEVKPEALVLAVTQRKEKHRVTTSLLKLTGTWRVDGKNRILFEVEKEAGKNDRLLFQGAWELGPHHEIIYSYETTRLKTKTQRTQTLVFKGYWDLSERHRLAFLIEGDTNSRLRFRGAFQTKSILAKAGEIRYSIGVELESRHEVRTVTLFGKWKISRDLELSFEMEYGGGEKRALTFGGAYHFNEDTSLEVRLKARDGKPLGVEVIFWRDFFGKNGQFFVRLRKTFEESAAEAGVRLRF